MRLLPLEYAVRNLGRSPLRLGVIVLGSALLVLIALTAGAFLRGMEQSMRRAGGPSNVILLSAGSEESLQRSQVDMGVVGVAGASISGIRELGGERFISPEAHVALSVSSEMQRAEGESTLASVRGVTPAALLVHESVTLTEGRFPSPGRDEVMVGGTVAARLGVSDASLSKGARLWIDGRPWTVVGRFAAEGTMVESEIWAHLQDVMDALKRETASCVIVTLDPARGDFEDVAVFTMTRPDLQLVAMRETDYYAALASFFSPIRAVIWATTIIMVAGGLLGGLNTLYAAFAGRIREFGTLQAIGFRRRAILLSLIQESLVATSAGALLACGAALLFLDGLAVRFSMGAFGLMVDSTVIAGALLLGLGLGLIGAVPPALRCFRRSIPSALKAA